MEKFLWKGLVDKSREKEVGTQIVERTVNEESFTRTRK